MLTKVEGKILHLNVLFHGQVDLERAHMKVELQVHLGGGGHLDLDSVERGATTHPWQEEEDGDNQEGGKDDSGMVGDAAGDQTQDGLPPLLRRQLHQAVKHPWLARCARCVFVR